MSVDHKRSILRFLPIALLSLTLAYVLSWRWSVSATRFFDIDEFSYLHWAAAVARGERPYIDFFSYFTPGFMWALAPIFWVYGVSVSVFTAARTVSFFIFLGILGALGYLFGITRGWKWALLPVTILAFLPMPYDKFLEIRPDNFSTLLAFLGLIGEIRAISNKKNAWWVFSGLMYSASLFVLAKALPFVAVGAGIAVICAVIVRSHKISGLLWFFLGLIGPWALFFLGAAIHGNLSQVWYSLTRLPFEVYQYALSLSMEAHLYFFPNPSFYGGDRYSMTIGLIVNHALWILAVLVGAYRVVMPFQMGKREKAIVEVLVGTVFVVIVLGYAKFFPAKHSQYLIPIAVFVAYYAADGLAAAFNWLTRIGGYASLVIILAGFSYLLVFVTREVNWIKLTMTNATQIAEISSLMKTIPLSSRVVDLEGRMVFWRDGYPLGGLPIDTTIKYVTQRPAPLAAYLSLHPADYIWVGHSGRLSTLTMANMSYVETYYAPVSGWGEQLWKRK